MKIGIFTYHHANNYGAYLQACALCNRLNEEKGLDVEIIDFVMKKELKFYSLLAKRIIRHPRSFIKNLYFQTKLNYAFKKARRAPIMKLSNIKMRSDSISDFTNLVYGKYDVIIVGSDEIWKLDGYRGFPTPYWLFGDLKCRKFSYAASSRSDFSKLDNEQKNILIQNLQEYEYIGVREKKTADSLKKLLGNEKEVHVCCDPTFLYDFPIREISIKELLNNKAKIDSKKKTIVVMTEDIKIARKIREVFGKDYNLVSVFHRQKGYQNVSSLLPLEWVEVIKNAELFVTTYFHGTCFSIINETPFITFRSEARSSKIDSLFEEMDDLRDRYILYRDEFLEKTDFKDVVINKMESINTEKYIASLRNEFEKFVDVLNNVEKDK